MKLHRSRQPSGRLVAAIPVIDAVLLFVVFFVLSANFVLQPGVAVLPPATPFNLAPLENAQIVTISGPPIPEIFYRSRKLRPEELQAAIDESPPDQRSVIIKADRQVPYDLVLQVTTPFLRKGFSVALASSAE